MYKWFNKIFGEYDLKNYAIHQIDRIFTVDNFIQLPNKKYE